MPNFYIGRLTGVNAPVSTYHTKFLKTLTVAYLLLRIPYQV